MSGKIYAPNKSNEIGGDPNDTLNKYADITGETLGTSRALHTLSIGGVTQLLELCELLIHGTLPEVNYDRIKMTTNTATSITLDFLYNDSIQFSMLATNPYTDFDIEIQTTSSVGLESGVDLFSLESGDELLLEG